jgi:GNAT superfamily N-acetyltransferase
MPDKHPPRIEPLSPRHARAAFSCGVRRIDEYLRHGLHFQAADLARLFVALAPSDRTTVIGYYALHNMHIEADAVPSPLGSSLRRDAIVGAVYIVTFAVDANWQNRGIGTRLFADALRRIKRISEESRTWAVVLDALNDRAEGFYRRFGFETLVGGTRRLFLPIDDIG